MPSNRMVAPMAATIRIRFTEVTLQYHLRVTVCRKSGVSPDFWRNAPIMARSGYAEGRARWTRPSALRNAQTRIANRLDAHVEAQRDPGRDGADHATSAGEHRQHQPGVA